MPLPGSATKKERSAARLERYRARKKGEEYFGKKAIKGKDMHHKDGNKKNHRKRNMKPVDPRKHGMRHGRGHRGSRLREAWLKLKGFMLSKEM